MSFFPGVIKNTLVQGLGRISVALATIFATGILTRVLGVSGFGTYVFITSFVLLFSAASDWGTGMISVREASKDKKIEKKIFENIFFFRFILAWFFFFLVNFLIRILPQFQNFVSIGTIASFLLFAYSLKTSFQVIFQTKLKFENVAFSEVFVSFFFLLFLVFGFSFLNLYWVFFFLVLVNFLGVIFSFFLAKKLVKIDFSFDFKIIKKIFLESLPTGALLLTFSIYNKVDVLILQIIKGSDPVGIYGLAYKIYDNLVLGASYLVNSLFPILSHFAAQKDFRQKLVLVYKKSFDVLFLASLTVVFLFFVFAPSVVEIIGGKEFSQSALALRILVFAAIFSFLNHLTGFSLIALGKQKISLIIALIALFWNVSLNFIFIPRYSYLASSGITIATEFLVFLLTSFYLAKEFGFRPSLSFWKTLIEIIRNRGKIF